MFRGSAGSAGPARDPAPPAVRAALCPAAVLSGNTAIEDVTAWVHHAPQEVLATARARRNALGIWAAPHPDTVVRIFAVPGHACASRTMPAPTLPYGPRPVVVTLRNLAIGVSATPATPKSLPPSARSSTIPVCS